MANPRNQASVANLRELLADASTFFLVDYQGWPLDEAAPAMLGSGKKGAKA